MHIGIVINNKASCQDCTIKSITKPQQNPHLPGLVGVAALVIVILSYVLGQPTWLPGADIIVTGTLRSAAWLIGPMFIAAILAFIKVRRPTAAR